MGRAGGRGGGCVRWRGEGAELGLELTGSLRFWYFYGLWGAVVELGEQGCVVTHPMAKLPTPAWQSIALLVYTAPHCIVLRCACKTLVARKYSGFEFGIFGKSISPKWEEAGPVEQSPKCPMNHLKDKVIAIGAIECIMWEHLPRRGLCWVLLWGDHSWAGTSNPIDAIVRNSAS